MPEASKEPLPSRFENIISQKQDEDNAKVAERGKRRCEEAGVLGRGALTLDGHDQDESEEPGEMNAAHTGPVPPQTPPQSLTSPFSRTRAAKRNSATTGETISRRVQELQESLFTVQGDLRHLEDETREVRQHINRLCDERHENSELKLQAILSDSQKEVKRLKTRTAELVEIIKEKAQYERTLEDRVKSRQKEEAQLRAQLREAEENAVREIDRLKQREDQLSRELQETKEGTAAERKNRLEQEEQYQNELATVRSDAESRIKELELEKGRVDKQLAAHHVFGRQFAFRRPQGSSDTPLTAFWEVVATVAAKS